MAFLNCGSALQPILPKSQCWCVDEQSSRFILQIRRPQYWRIELPVADNEDIRLALELKVVLDKVLQFEKTECPFRRSFTVELPERPQVPVKKRPWTPPVRQSLPTLPSSVTTGEVNLDRHHVEEEAPCETMQVETEVPADGRDIATINIVAYDESMNETAPLSVREDQPVVERKVVTAILGLEETLQKEKLAKLKEVSLRPAGFQASRSVTAPSLLTLTVEPTVPEAVPPEKALTPETQTAPVDLSHSLETYSPLTPLPPSPPLTAASSPQVLDALKNELPIAKTRPTTAPDTTATPITPATSTGDFSEVHLIKDEQTLDNKIIHRDEVSIALNIPATVESVNQEPVATQEIKLPSSGTDNVLTDMTVLVSSSTTSGANLTSDSAVTTRRPHMRHRATTSSSIAPNRTGGLPRLASAANLFSSYRNQSNTQSQLVPSTLSLVKRLPMAIIHKTIEILLSPPSHLVDLMLKVAARITAGEWRGYIYGFSDQGERIPVRWDWSDEDDDGEGELGGWHADEDWGFGRTDGKTPLKMAGAFPESPDGNDEERGRDLIPPNSERDASPSASRGTSRSQDKQNGTWSVD